MNFDDDLLTHSTSLILSNAMSALATDHLDHLDHLAPIDILTIGHTVTRSNPSNRSILTEPLYAILVGALFKKGVRVVQAVNNNTTRQSSMVISSHFVVS